MAPLLSPLQSTILKSVDCHVGDRMYFFFLTKQSLAESFSGPVGCEGASRTCDFIFCDSSPDSSASSVILSLCLYCHLATKPKISQKPEQKIANEREDEGGEGGHNQNSALVLLTNRNNLLRPKQCLSQHLHSSSLRADVSGREEKS